MADVSLDSETEERRLALERLGIDMLSQINDPEPESPDASSPRTSKEEEEATPSEESTTDRSCSPSPSPCYESSTCRLPTCAATPDNTKLSERPMGKEKDATYLYYDENPDEPDVIYVRPQLERVMEGCKTQTKDGIKYLQQNPDHYSILEDTYLSSQDTADSRMGPECTWLCLFPHTHQKKEQRGDGNTADSKVQDKPASPDDANDYEKAREEDIKADEEAQGVSDSTTKALIPDIDADADTDTDDDTDDTHTPTDNNKPTTSRVPINDFIEVRDVSISGSGMFARRGLAAADVILMEAPLLTSNYYTLSKRFAMLEPLAKRVFLCLHPHWLHGQEKNDIVGAIYRSNCFQILGGTAVFPIAARFNHACADRCNVHYGYDARRQLLVFSVKAAGGIAAGEELTISYGGTSCSLYQRYGFFCQCGACRGMSEEEIRRFDASYNWV